MGKKRKESRVKKGNQAAQIKKKSEAAQIKKKSETAQIKKGSQAGQMAGRSLEHPRGQQLKEKPQEAAEEVLSARHLIRKHKGKASLYVVLRILVVLVMVAQFFNGNYDNVFLCVLTLLLFLIPSFIDKRLHIELPNTLEIVILLFIFAAEILGEVQQYYLIFDHWDTMLHTMNGFIMAAIGFSLIDILNRSDRVAVHLSPVFVAMVAFCFSMTIGVLWEFFEFGMDWFTHSDMQKDTIIHSISSVLLNPNHVNIPVTVPIHSVVVNGESWPGYIDIGLIDTMMDLFVNFIGATVFSIIGVFYIKGRGKGTFARRFIPKMKSKEAIEADRRETEEFFEGIKETEESIVQSISQHLEHNSTGKNTKI